MTTSCWFAQFSSQPCEGGLIRAHLIPKQRFRAEFPNGAVLVDGKWLRAVEGQFMREDPEVEIAARRTLAELQDDERAWRPCCGGLVGLTGHHGDFDGHRLHISFTELPSETIEYAAELGFLPRLERTYGPPK
jgi:hypothetical protein